MARKEEGELAADDNRRDTVTESQRESSELGGDDGRDTNLSNGVGGGDEEEPSGEEHAEEIAAAVPYEPGRWGSQQVFIDQVRMLDSQGGQHYVFTCGDPMTIELTLKAEDPVDDFAIGVGIFNADGVCCYGTNTDIERFVAAKLQGTASVRMEIQALNLIEGTYYLDLAVHRLDGYPYDYQRGLTRFRTTSPIGDTGVARLPHRWSFEGGIEWKKTGDSEGQ